MADVVSNHRGVTQLAERGPRPDRVKARRAARWVARSCVAAQVLVVSVAYAQVQAQETAAAPPQAWKRDLRLDLGLVISDNVLLQGRGNERADVVFRTAPSIGLRRTTGRLRFDGRYSPVILGYLNDALEESLFNVLNAKATYELVDNRAFIDATAFMNQTFLSPFGSQPAEFATGTFNRIEVRTFSVSPFITGSLAGGGRYRIRNDNSYTSFAAQSAFSITTTGVSGEVSGSRGSLVSLGADGAYSLSSYGSGAELLNQSANVRATLNASQEFVPYVTGGYESNEFFLALFQGPRYGGGFKWLPSPRTAVDFKIEKRYFGTSVDLNASYRTRLSLWSLRAYRTDRITPAAGGFGAASLSTRDFLSDLLRTQFADEAERQIAVERLLSAGLFPSTLSQQAALASPRVLLVEGVEPSVALTGVRNTGLATIFWRRNSPLSGNGSVNVTDIFNTINAFEQVGFSLTWSHKLTPQTSASTGVDWFDTKSVGANAFQPASLRTDQSVFRFFLTKDLAADTSVTAGIRFTRLSAESSVGPTTDARERALQFGVVHKFF